jgi:hypothetical protein
VRISAVLWLALALAFGYLIVKMLRARSILKADEAWRPAELMDAELAYAERVFRSAGPVSIVAKVDRAYRKSGVVTLIEFKTRAAHRPYPSDVIELSAQHYALSTGRKERVADYGYGRRQVVWRFDDLCHAIANRRS